MTPSKSLPSVLALLLLAVILISGAAVSIYTLERDSLWYDEGWTMWTVYDDAPAPDGLRETAGYVLNSVAATFNRVRQDDVHPPLYYLLLDGWTLVMGESVFVVRLLSVFFGMIALAATYTIGTNLFDRKTALIALVLMSTAGLYLYYTREARMYTLLLALACLAALAFLRWMTRPTLRRALLYGVLLSLMLYTQYLGILMIITQGVYLLIMKLTRGSALQWRAIPVPYGAALILFAPWLPFFIQQIRLHPGGPLPGGPAGWDWSSWAAFWLVITSGNWLLFVAPCIFSRAIPLALTDRKIRQAVLFLLLWLLVTPALLMAVSAYVARLFEMRYLIITLPAGALLVAFALRNLQLPIVQLRIPVWVRTAIILLILGWMVYTQLITYCEFWKPKPRWQQAITQVIAERAPAEPAITSFPATSVTAYYDRQYGLREGITVDIGWRDHVPEEINALVDKLDNAKSVWLMLPGTHAKSWDAYNALKTGHTIGYRDSVMGMTFYRFDKAAADTMANWDFEFYSSGNNGTQSLPLAAYEAGTGHQLYARIGEQFCWDIDLRALQDIESDNYTAAVYMTQGYNTIRARADVPIAAISSGAAFTLSACVDIPADSPRGPYHMRLAIYRNTNAQNQFVMETGGVTPQYWGDFVVVGVVSVDSGDAED